MALEQYTGAIDQGTSGTRFIIFDKSGNILSSAYLEHKQIFPGPGLVEHDPVEIWKNTQYVIKKCFSDTTVSPKQIKAIGITNQRETTIAWNRKSGKPYYNAIVWQDTRTGEICNRLEKKISAELIKKKTGLIISNYFSAAKIIWLLENIKGLKQKCRNGEVLFGTVNSWLIWNLTNGKFITDVTNASRTLLMNINSLEWDEELLSVFDIPKGSLPRIRPSSDRDIYGYTDKNGVFNNSIPVCGSLGDQQAALFGQACFDPGDVKNTYGTGNFILANTGIKPVFSGYGLLTTAAYSMEPGKAAYALEGSIAVTGAAVQWLRDNLGIIKNAAESEEIAGSVKDTGGVNFVPAFSGLFAPYWDKDARGVITGLTGYSGKAHIVRAALEAICYQTRDVVEAMKNDLGRNFSSIKVDGGASLNNLLMQMQADISGITCIRPAVNETTALGAAYAAGLASGYWNSLEDLRANWKEDRSFSPEWDESQRNKGYKNWKKAVEKSKE